MRVSQAGQAQIKKFESFREFAYPDPASPLGRATVGIREIGFAPFDTLQLPQGCESLSGAPWTVGYGFIEGVTRKSRISRTQADARLVEELEEYEDGVYSACKVRPNQNQFDAMVSLAWNVGISGVQNSTVMKAHNRGDVMSASRAFGLWNKAGGKVSSGLTRRRALESAMYLRPAPSVARQILENAIPSAAASDLSDFTEHDMPQKVDPESSLISSPINKASIAGGATALAIASESVSTVSNLKFGIESLGDWLLPVLLLAVVGLCGYIIWNRYKQRSGGWA